MSDSARDNPAPKPPAPPVSPPPVARSTRRTFEQVVNVTPFADTFATPSETPTPEPPTLSGPEPAIFGGVNPVNPPPPQLPTNPGSPADEEDEVTGSAIPAPRLRNMVAFVLESNLILLVLLVLSLVLGTWILSGALPARNEVTIRIEMRSAIEPTEEETASQQQEINSIIRGYPLRRAAMTILQKESPQISPGFLDGLAFSSSTDAIEWDGAHGLTLRVKTKRPADDGPRLHAAARALLQVCDVRQQAYEDRVGRVENYRAHLRELRSQQQDLLADQARETDPTTIARYAQQLKTLERRIEKTIAEIEQEQRIVDTWLMPERIAPEGVQAYDNRAIRRAAMLGMIATLLLLLGTPMVMNLRSRRRFVRARRRSGVVARRHR